MASYEILNRYSHIIEKVRGKRLPSFKDIQTHMASYDIAVSKRTIDRDIQAIRNEFGIDISYDRTRNGYFIDEESSLNNESFFRLLEIMTTADLIAESIREGKEIISCIEFDSRGCLHGLQHIRPLLAAIRKRRLVKFEHENYHSGKTWKFTVSPCFLKEYQNRFYLVGRVKGVSELWSFGLDRIKDLTVTDKACDAITGDERKVFSQTIGLTYSAGAPEDVVLSFDPIQGKYIKSLPWHRSQKILEDNEKELLIKLRVVPNFELSQKILMLGDTVKVLAPLWFAKDIKDYLEAALNRYK
ncbi:MAG: WYL domain-containing protein [Candidatus Riflebacteria bacterium]|nr:WYL domain-containing protein [Candidatus Riflebacteria bacterium]